MHDSHAQGAAGSQRAPSVAAVGTAAAPVSVPLPALRGEYTAPRLVLAGVVPDEGERRALIARARSVYGASHVTDRLVVAVVANPAWLSPAFLPDLRGTRHATLWLEDGRLVVEGEVGSTQALAAVTGQLDGLRDQGLVVDNRLRAPAR